MALRGTAFSNMFRNPISAIVIIIYVEINPKTLIGPSLVISCPSLPLTVKASQWRVKASHLWRIPGTGGEGAVNRIPGNQGPEDHNIDSPLNAIRNPLQPVKGHSLGVSSTFCGWLMGPGGLT